VNIGSLTWKKASLVLMGGTKWKAIDESLDTVVCALKERVERPQKSQSLGLLGVSLGRTSI
jgi:hypothetical protein